SSHAYRLALQPHVQNSGRLMIRLLPDDFDVLSSLKAEINSVLKFFGLTPASVDLLVDMRSVVDPQDTANDIVKFVGSLPDLKKWKTLTVAGGSFPSSLNPHAPHTWHSQQRMEREAWLTARKYLTALRLPSYSDYGVRDIGAPAKFGAPAPNIRYTVGTAYLFRRHDLSFKDGGSAGIFPICASLISSNMFSGAQFSSGDELIEYTGTSQISTGNPTNWTAWGMSHHFEAVAGETLTLLAA
ncbi:MAG: hypothetical protein V4734_00425, partial [Terriglobus sp.]